MKIRMRERVNSQNKRGVEKVGGREGVSECVS